MRVTSYGLRVDRSCIALIGKRYFCYMALKSIRIENFKSIGDIEIVNPQPFSVLVGPNAAGKSNIFAALQFWHSCQFISTSAVISAFGGKDNLMHRNLTTSEFKIIISIDEFQQEDAISYELEKTINMAGFLYPRPNPSNLLQNIDFFRKLVLDNFSRIFVRNERIVAIPVNDDSKLAPDASNLEKVLKRILNDEEIRGDFLETLQLFIPGLDKLEVVSSEFSSNLDILVYEKALTRPINRELISDGTYNIIAILTALYQSKTPQFLCIEEPENGLNPKVVKHLVALCKDLCEEHGHYIWLNTHSQSIVSQLQPEEIILVDKIDGFTKAKQFEKGSFEGMRMDEAWLTNSMGGGLPW